MECRVNQASRYGVIIAFSGHEYVKYEWRPVPAGCEAEAERHPYLEIKPVGGVVPDGASYIIGDTSGVAVPLRSEGGPLPEEIVISEPDPVETFVSQQLPDKVEEVAPAAVEPVLIDPSDGISDAEASAAGKALATKKAQEVQTPRRRNKR